MQIQGSPAPVPETESPNPAKEPVVQPVPLENQSTPTLPTPEVSATEALPVQLVESPAKKDPVREARKPLRSRRDPTVPVQAEKTSSEEICPEADDARAAGKIFRYVKRFGQ
jgi:hypothetical protein